MTLSANENPFLDKCGYARVEQEEDELVKEGKHKWHETPEQCYEKMLPPIFELM